MTKELKTLLEFDQLRADSMSKMKATYLALGIEPDHTRYGVDSGKSLKSYQTILFDAIKTTKSILPP